MILVHVVAGKNTKSAVAGLNYIEEVTSTGVTFFIEKTGNISCVKGTYVL